ncbi:MAG: hypothetical protein U5N86_11125 [Planctomycetota bacterium]|nr:hypothetical protein [Planctomycetota bacterium]
MTHHIRENAGNDGYTPEGASIAAGSIYWYFDKASDAIQAHMGYIFYRNRYVHGNRRTIGIGYDSPVFCFNESNLDNDPPRYEYPIRIPGPGQKIPYIHFSTHSATFQPDPRPGASGCGFPITLTWDYASNVELKDAKLFLVKGEKEIAQQIASSGPNKPAVPNYYQNNQGMIAIIPLNTLEPKATYRVVIDYTDGGEEKNIDYYFTTANVAKN